MKKYTKFIILMLKLKRIIINKGVDRVRKRIISIITTVLIFSFSTPVQPIYAQSTKLIAFTYDDGPSNYTEQLLEGLEARAAKATFFMTGANGGSGINNHPEILDRMVKNGFQLANHTYEHLALSKLSASDIQYQVTTVGNLITTAMGGDFRYMVRTPGGSINDTIRGNVGAPIILWSLDTLDWKTRDAGSVYNTIVNNAADGDIVLLHDLYQTSIDGSLQAIDVLQSQGYECVTVAELMRRRGVILQNGATYTNAPTHEEAGTLSAYSAPTLSSVFNNEAMHTLVTITTDSTGMALHYTTDGTDPNLSSMVYTEPLKLERTCTLKVFGVDEFGTETPMITEEINVPSSPTPTVRFEKNKLTIETTDKDASIYYTDDGSIPTLESIKYQKPIKVYSDIIRCIAGKSGFTPSEIVTCSFTSENKMITDVSPDKWYYNPVMSVLNKGIMQEASDYLFAPEQEINKEDFLISLYNMAKTRIIPSCKIKNVDSPIDWLISKNIIMNENDLMAKITREEAAEILYNFSVNVYKNSSSERLDLSNIFDSGNIAERNLEAVSWCAAKGLLNIDDSQMFYPKNKLNRAQCASILLVLRDMNTEVRSE